MIICGWLRKIIRWNRQIYIGSDETSRIRGRTCDKRPYFYKRRPYLSVKSRSDSAWLIVRAPKGQRQLQFPSTVPGVFILADDGNPRRSWTGAIAIAATELQIALSIPI